MFPILVQPRLHSKNPLDRFHTQHLGGRSIAHDRAIIEQDKSAKTPNSRAAIVYHRHHPHAIRRYLLQELHDMPLARAALHPFSARPDASAPGVTHAALLGLDYR
jgi:hypothetical protein